MAGLKSESYDTEREWQSAAHYTGGSQVEESGPS